MRLSNYSSKFSKKQIILLSIPVFFSNLAIPLVGIVDTGLMGNLGETKYLAATSIATSVMTMVIWSFGFLRMGTVGIVSQAYGRADKKEIFKTLQLNNENRNVDLRAYLDETFSTYQKLIENSCVIRKKIQDHLSPINMISSNNSLQSESSSGEIDQFLSAV